MNPNVGPADKDGWFTTSCNACFNVCAIRVKVQDGRIVDVKGDHRVPSSKGKVCGKSQARIADLYNPKRITRPLKRTNPEKGLGVDPKWREISWDEALDLIVGRLKALMADDPRKLVVSTFDLCNFYIAQSFGVAFGTPNYEFYPVSCGNGLHTTFFLTLGTINSEIDLEYCDYIMLWGSQLGHGVNNNPLEAIRHMADARRRGAKLVVVDPICGQAAAKADEWIPIRPGTDSALALGMVNVLLNDLGLYDREYLKRKTNAPYLVRADGRYVRDQETGQPLLWDSTSNRAGPYDSPDLSDPALEGVFQVNGEACRPAFDLLKEHVKKNYPLDRVQEITTVPRETIRRVAREFAEAARIGATIEIEGQTLPLRPAALEFKRGVSHHKNSFFNVFSLQLLNIVLGNLDAVGGLIGTNANGPTGYWTMSPGRDGLVTSNIFTSVSGGRGSFACFMSPYPPNPVSPPEWLNLRQLLPLTGFIPSLCAFTIHDPDKFKMPYRPSVMIHCRSNMVVSNNDPKFQAEMLKKLDFMVSFNVKMDETSEFADLVLPETHDFEKYWFFPANQPAGFQKPGLGDWYYQTVRPVVAPPPGVRNWIDVMMEIAERLGILSELNAELNRMTGLALWDELALQADVRYSLEEIHDRTVRLFAAMNGVEVTDDLFTDANPILPGPKKELSECYPGALSEARVPVYFEYFLEVGEEVRRVTREIGLDWWDTSHYQPLADWRPCPAHEDRSKEYDLFVVSSRLPLHGQSNSADNPWVDDICRHSRMDYNVLLNTETAARKGINDGDMVWIESRTGKVQGKVRVTGAVHVETVGILGGHLGQWARDKMFARGKGIHINSLVAHDWNMVGTLTGQLDTCAKVKIYKV
ncbi:MAG: molybdopterin-dependent oxidoreductase [Thermodesulfobacteriota bacterium]